MGDDALIVLLLLLLVVVVAVPVLAIVALVKVSRAQDRIAALEAQVAALRQAPSAAPLTPPLAEPLSAPPAAAEPFRWDKAAPLDPQLLPRVPRKQAAAEPAGPPALSLSVAPDAVARREPLPPAEAPPPPPIQIFAAWLATNWVYVISALSLALAGVFFVQYGIENGLLPPPMRVLAGVAFGGLLIAGGEWLRRRYGSDEAAGSTQYLPSVFSGAGLVAIFAAVTAGRLMYDLYGPGLTFAGLFLTALGAILLGWRNGPFLVAVGLLGASAAPFLVAGGAEPQAWLYAYYLLIAAIGLAVDAWRRWGWVSIMALALAQLGLFAMREGGAGVEPWLIAQIVFVILAIALPGRSLTPRHPGPGMGVALQRAIRPLPGLPVRLAGGAVLAATLQILVVMTNGPVAGLMPYLALTVMALLLIWWTEEAPGLSDLAALPALAFLFRLGIDQPLLGLWQQNDAALLPPETSGPGWVSWLLAMATLMTAAFAWRSLRSGNLLHTLAAVLAAPVAALILEALWLPGRVLGAFPWALHVVVLAAAMVWLASAFAKRDGGPGRRFAWATLSALSLIALAVFILTAEAALTLALGVLLVVAVALDRRFTLPEMGWFLQAGAAVLSYRLVIDPGIGWANGASLPALLTAHLGVALACGAAWRLLPEGRALPRAVLESLGLAALALLVNLLLLRWLTGAPRADGNWSPDYFASHWGAALNALPWLILFASQLWRAGASTGIARRLRLAVAGLAGALGAAALISAVTLLNPLFETWGGGNLILGPPLLDTLALAYAVPGLLLLGYLRLDQALRPWARRAVAAVGGALLTLYAVTEIRRLWQGRDISGSTVLQGELYSYTLALLLCGAVLLWQALARRSVVLRRVAMAVIALTVAKVFLWDVSGLSGLVRVLSFAGLGLSLAGLAWLNRWAGHAMDAGDEATN